MSDSDDFSEIDCDQVLPGSTGSLMLRSVTKEFFELESNKQARLMSNMKVWADGYKLTQEQFNGNEGRCGGSNDRMMVALKTHKIRLYGFVRQYRKMKTLIVVDIDPAKKQDRARGHVLKRAKSAVIRMDDQCDG